MTERLKNNVYMRAYRNGMTVDQLLAFLESHGRECGICGVKWDDNKRGGGLVLDHDHSCCASQDPSTPVKDRPKRLCGSCHRGLLCVACNTAIGQFADRTELLESAILYLKRPRVALPPATGKVGPAGDQHGMRKLSSGQVAEIRARHAQGGITYAKLGEIHGVSGTMISNIVNYRYWK